MMEKIDRALKYSFIVTSIVTFSIDIKLDYFSLIQASKVYTL